MKIVVLDGYTLNPGDLHWEDLKAVGTLIVYDRTRPEDIVKRCRDAQAVLTNKVPLDRNTLSQLPGLQYVGVLATGYNIVDVAFARERGIAVTNVPGYGTDSVVQLTFALLLELCWHVQHHSDAVHQEKWSRSADFCFWDFRLVELSGKTMGIIGYGSIGKKVAAVASAFGMRVVAAALNGGGAGGAGIDRIPLDELLSQADVVTTHCPLTAETRGLINKEALQKMRSSAFLLNTSRGPIIVEQDLADALAEGVIAGAGVDVLSIEPPAASNPLLAAPNCIITPHIGWATREARSRLMDQVVHNLVAFIAGQPVNRID
jgi:glycerate dehydrogenase